MQVIVELMEQLPSVQLAGASAEQANLELVDLATGLGLTTVRSLKTVALTANIVINILVHGSDY